MIEKEKTIVIASQFRGPPHSGNGGYVGGVLAKFIDGPAAVTLRAPVPLDRNLQLSHETDGGGDSPRFLLDDPETGQRIAEVQPDRLDLSPPPPPSWDDACAIAETGGSPAENAFGGCFVCGQSRTKGDGLQVWAGTCTHTSFNKIAVAPFVPDRAFAGSNGEIGSEYHWAALDCPGAVAVYDGRVMLTGRMTGAVHRRLHAGEKGIVIGWPLGTEGARKIYSGTAIYGENGELCASAYSLWITLKQDHPNYEPPN